MGVLHLCRDTVGVFYNTSWLGMGQPWKNLIQGDLKVIKGFKYLPTPSALLLKIYISWGPGDLNFSFDKILNVVEWCVRRIQPVFFLHDGKLRQKKILCWFSGQSSITHVIPIHLKVFFQCIANRWQAKRIRVLGFVCLGGGDQYHPRKEKKKERMEGKNVETHKKLKQCIIDSVRVKNCNRQTVLFECKECLNMAGSEKF